MPIQINQTVKILFEGRRNLATLELKLFFKLSELIELLK